MRVLQHFILFIVFVISSFNSFSQKLNNTFYHMSSVPQVGFLNPAFQPDYNIYVGVPFLNSIYANYANTSFNYSDIITEGSGIRSDSLVYNVDGFIDALKSRNFVSAHSELSLLSLGLRYKKYFFSFAINDKTSTRLSFGKKIFEFARDGNFNSLGKNINLGAIDLDASYYREFSFGASTNLGDKLTVGVHAKVLMGMANMYTGDSYFSTKTSADGSELNLTLKQDVYTSIPINEIKYKSDGTVRKVNFNNKDFGLGFFTNTSNLGFALDLGVNYKADKQTTLSASILDLGFISWSSDVNRFNQNADFNYKGADWSQSDDENKPNYKSVNKILKGFADSLKNQIGVNASEEKYKTYLSAKMYLAASHQISEKTNLAVVSRTEIYRSKLFPSISVSANTNLSKYFSASMSYSIANNSYYNLGLGFSSKIGPVQLYALTDNIIAGIMPDKARTVNFRLGLNLIFGDNYKETKTSCNLDIFNVKKDKVKKNRLNIFRKKTKSNKRKIKQKRNRSFKHGNKRSKNKIKKRHRW